MKKYLKMTMIEHRRIILHVVLTFNNFAKMKTNACPAHDFNLSSINKSYVTYHVDESLAPGILQAGEDIEPGTLHK